jgi:hypothetical protein
MSWYLDNNNELMQDDFPEPIDYLTPPYPASMWQLDSNDELVLSFFPEPIAAMTPPYPTSIWYLDSNNELVLSFFPEPIGYLTPPLPPDIQDWCLDPTTDIITHVRLPEPIIGNLIDGNDSGPPYYGYPASYWYYDGTQLTMNKTEGAHPFTPMIGPVVDLDNNINDNNLMMPPYPASFWRLTPADLILNGLLPTPINEPLLTKPYPASFWWYEEADNRLEKAIIPNELYCGSFLDCTSLTYVKIPSTVKQIAERAFWNTRLTLVRIPEGCRYGVTSFPPGCEVQTYSVN